MWLFNTEAFEQLQTEVYFPILCTPTGHCQASGHVKACINVYGVASPASFHNKSTRTSGKATTSGFELVPVTLVLFCGQRWSGEAVNCISLHKCWA